LRGVDCSVIALWLGHESVETTQVYLEATMATKEQALGKTTPVNGKFGRYRPGDPLLGSSTISRAKLCRVIGECNFGFDQQFPPERD